MQDGAHFTSTQLIERKKCFCVPPVNRNAKQLHVSILYTDHRRSRRLRCLRRGSAIARLLGLRVLIPPEASLSVASVMRCQVEVSAMG
jgi:hypothetical protein